MTRKPQRTQPTAASPSAALRTSSFVALRATALFASALAAVGCAQSVGDIDRTQPDLIDKEHFDGQWFMRETVVEVPTTAAAAFNGSMGGLETVTWEIREDLLVGYRAYERIPGSEGVARTNAALPNQQPVDALLNDGRDPDTYHGEPVVAYRIQNHVDVIRSYNSRTGEQTNVIVENQSDRPWYERSFMRVDWSANVIENFDFEPYQFWPFMQNVLDAEEFVPANEGGPDAFNIEFDEQGVAQHMDFTVRRAVQASAMGCNRARSLMLGDCTAQVLKVRTSLERVDVEREQDYVPIRYDDLRQGEFGFFRTERPSYNRNVGITFEGLIQVANRHDLWADAYDDLGNPKPYWERTIRPLTYTLSADFPSDLHAVAEEIAAEFDSQFKDVAAAARQQPMAEFLADLRDDTGSECLFCLDKNLDGEARNGDLRYNFIYWVDDAQITGPLGYGPSSVNPETGRIVSSAAYVYGASVDRYADNSKLLVDLMNGQLEEEDVTGAEYFREQARGARVPVDPRGPFRDGTFDAEGFGRQVLGGEAAKRLAQLQEAGVDALLPALPGYEQTRINKVAGTSIEAMMVPPEWVNEGPDDPTYLKLRAQARGLTGVDPNSGLPAHLSLKNWYWGGAGDDFDYLEEVAMENNVWLADFEDPLIVGLAKQARDEGLTGDALRTALRERLFRAVMLHEIGHTIGLRHNFGASADPLNYHPEYWEQRVKTIEPYQNRDRLISNAAPDSRVFLLSNCTYEGDMPAVDGESLIPNTSNVEACREQREAGMAEYQYSSIMDYGGRPNADFHGLGHYDRAALAAGYGDLVEVFDEEAMQGLARGSAALAQKLNATPDTLDARSAMLDANEIRTPVLGQGFENALARRAFQVGSPALLGVSHYSVFPEYFDGHENLEKRRFMPRVDYERVRRESTALGAEAARAVPVKVPYMSCYDEYRGSIESCNTWDIGADHYEIVSNYIAGYKEYYVFNNFSRDRINFSSFDVFNRVRGRYLVPIATMYQHWLWGAAVTRLGDERTPRGALGAMATEEGLNTLLNIVSTPAYGVHVFDRETSTYVPGGGECNELVDMISMEGRADGEELLVPECLDVPQGLGRSLFSRFNSSGYDVFRRMTESGNFYDQMAAIQALTVQNAAIVGLGTDVDADRNSFRLPYSLIFQDRISSLFSAVYLEDFNVYGQPVVQDEAGVHVQPASTFTTAAAEAQLGNAPVVQPGRSFTTRIQSLVNGMALADGDLTTTFANQGQISLAGSGETRSVPEGFIRIEMPDPSSGRVFHAFRPEDGEGGPWYAAGLLEQSNEVRLQLEALGPEPSDLSEEAPEVTQERRSLQAQLDGFMGDIELMREISNIFRQ